MNRFNLDIKNPGPILHRFRDIFSGQYNTAGTYLHLPAQHDYQNPLNLQRDKNVLGMKEELLPEVLHSLGIRSMTLFGDYELSGLQALSSSLLGDGQNSSTDYLKSPALISELSGLFANAKVIAFDDWSNFAGADIWQRLLSGVITPLARRDLEFVFYLGDASSMPSFEVDRALDIITGFASAGRITLALDEGEAVSLWKLLNGVSQQLSLGPQTVVDLKKKYFSVYRTLELASLLVYSTDSALLFSSSEQFSLSRKNVDIQVEQGSNARENFILGYSAGLHGDMGLAQSITLGLVVFGACGRYQTAPDQQAIQSYISDWISDLDKPESIHLYQ